VEGPDPPNLSPEGIISGRPFSEPVPELRCPLPEPLEVLGELRRVSSLPAQRHLIPDEDEDGLWVCSQSGVLLEVGFDEDWLARLPAHALFRLEDGYQRHGLRHAVLSQFSSRGPRWAARVARQKA
jgi:hypothetical protein